MATVTSTSPQATGSFREIISRPWVATALVIAYIAVTVIVLLSLNRADVWFPMYSTIAFPAFVLSPFVILASPMLKQVKTALILALILVVMPLLGMYDGAYL